MVKQEPLKKIIKLIDKGNNIFITGGGGVGKSYILRKLKEHYDKYYKDDKKFQITSTTGVSAFNIGGQTIHSFSGIFHKKIYVNYPDTKRKLTKNLKECKILAIDEISMLDKVTLDSLNRAFKEITGLWNKPFGGIQMVFIGDFFQLPPVPETKYYSTKYKKYRKKDKAEYCFKSYAWEAGNFITIDLQEVKRQSDKNFISALNKIRTGNITQEVINIFKERERNYSIETNHKILYLFSKTEKMDNHNDNMLTEDVNCSGKIKTYTATDYYCKFVDDKKVIEDIIPITGTKNDEYKEAKDKLNFECRYSEELNLRNGCKVMLLKNLDLGKGLVNGSCGIVKSHSENEVVVKFDRVDEDITIKKETFSFQYRYIEDEETGKIIKESAKRIQFPLQLAYAITIHKAQGMTFDELVVDLDNSFSEGMSYVALSRNRTLENLYIKHFKPEEIKTSKEVIDFYANLKNCITFTENGEMIDNTEQKVNKETEDSKWHDTLTTTERPLHNHNTDIINEVSSYDTETSETDDNYFDNAYTEQKLDNEVKYSEGNNSEYAISYYNNKIASDPYNCKYLNYRAEAYYENGEYEEAVNDWDNILELEPEYELDYLKKAYAEHQIDELQQAINDYTKYLEDNSQDALAYFYRGLVKENSDDYNYGDVIEDYSEAIKRDPCNCDYLKNRADAYYENKEFENAVADWNNILEKNPEYEIDYFDKANAEYKIEQYENALKSIEKYLDNNPKNEDAENLKDWLNKKLEPYDKKLITEHIEKAEAFYENEEYVIAINEWNKVLEIDPEHEIDYFKKAFAEAEIKQFSEAIEDYTRYIEDNPDCASAYNNRSCAKECLKDYSYEYIIEDYTKAIELDSNEPLYLDNRANTYYNNKKYTKAVADWNNILEKNPEYEIDYFDKAYAEYELGQYTAAINDYTQYLLNNPNDAGAFNNRGLCKFKGKDYKGAIEDYTTAIKLEPQKVKYINNRADAYYENEEYENAVNEWNNVLEIDPEYEINYFNKAYAEAEIGLYSEAIDDYIRYLEDNPNIIKAYYNRGLCKFKIQDYKGAIEDFTIYINNDPNYTYAYINRAKVYYKSKEFEKAVVDWNKVLEIDSNYEINYFDKANAEYKIGQYEIALLSLEKYLNKNPNDKNASDLKNFINEIVTKNKNEKLISEYLEKAKNYIDNGSYDSAYKYCERILEFDENNAYAYLYLGMYYQDNGYNNEAIKYYNKAIEIDNTMKLAYGNIGIIYYLKKNYNLAIRYLKVAIELDPSIQAFKEYLDKAIWYKNRLDDE